MFPANCAFLSTYKCLIRPGWKCGLKESARGGIISSFEYRSILRKTSEIVYDVLVSDLRNHISWLPELQKEKQPVPDRTTMK
jgi:hypothetical protein